MHRLSGQKFLLVTNVALTLSGVMTLEENMGASPNNVLFLNLSADLHVCSGCMFVDTFLKVFILQ